ncbi:MAG TPA: MBL fold metallo-hydrolase [Flavitalea sp.]|nr:MBL fold metallo-hydrolase [Flavitalea sp.]
MKKERVAKKDLYLNCFNVAPGVWGLKDLFVNVYMIHNAVDNNWVLIDAGLKTSAPKIRRMAEHLFWPDTRPSAIVLTHAHFDHVGSLNTLAEEWEIPVYAHAMEKPYLTGLSSYPPPDPSVGGGLMSSMSWLYPKGPIDIERRLQVLPQDGSIPGLPEWRYFHTPGHAPGHISLYRQRDGVLIAGDAFVTTKQESSISVILQSKKMSGPPKYFTYNWESAARSVRTLADLNPEVVATGHGKPMRGADMRRSLHNLADHFEELAVPSHGRYVGAPALVNEEGVQYLPPVGSYGLILKIAGLTAIAIVGLLLTKKYTKKKALFDFNYN